MFSSPHLPRPASAAEVAPGLGRDADIEDAASFWFSAGRSFLIAVMAGVAVLAVTGASADQSDMISEPIAVLQGLDKITARVSEIEAPVGKTVHFGSLAITVRDCEKNPPEDRPESAAFLQIDEVRPGEDSVRWFSGWMFAQSPALSSLENPVYDVILLDCKGASGSAANASGSATGNVAK
jgi:hypothetical protein